MENIQQLFNVRDLLLIAFLAVSGILGAQRGLTRTFTGLLGRLASTIAAVCAAKFLAPIVARAVVTPIIGDLFERDAESYLASLAEPIETAVTEMAVEMAEGVAFLLLLALLGVFFSLLLALISQSLHFLSRHTPLGILDRMGGLALGVAGGAVLLAVAAILLTHACPELFRDLGWLSPKNTENTILTRAILELLPVYP